MAAVAPQHRRSPFLWSIAFIVLTIFVGLRHHVGMDWNNYLHMIQKVNLSDFWHALTAVEPGYGLLLWIAGQNGWGVYGAYLLGTIIFMAGLFRFAKSTPAPWIALLAAMPYLVVVVAMSAARQAVSIGVLLWLFAEWKEASVAKRITLVIFASLFHFSASIFFAFVFLDLRLPIWVKAIAVSVISLMVVFVLDASGHADYYEATYLEDTQASFSPGAISHVLLNAGPALLCFLFGRRVRCILLPTRLQSQLAIFAIMLLMLAPVLSTVASRLSIYLFPVSMSFFATLPALTREPAR